MKCDGCLFDLDGTLWNATEAIARAWELALKDEPDIQRLPTLREVESVMGMGPEELMHTLFPYLSGKRSRELFEKCTQAENVLLRQSGGKLYPGVEEMLEKLSQRLPLAVVSNCNVGYIPSFLEAHHLEKYFTDQECAGKTGLDKAANIRLVVERNQLKAPVYVGDTEIDRASAEKAGVPFIHAAYGFGTVSGTPKIEKPLDLLTLLDA